MYISKSGVSYWNEMRANASVNLPGNRHLFFRVVEVEDAGKLQPLIIKLIIDVLCIQLCFMML